MRYLIGSSCLGNVFFCHMFLFVLLLLISEIVGFFSSSVNFWFSTMWFLMLFWRLWFLTLFMFYESTFHFSNASVTNSFEMNTFLHSDCTFCNVPFLLFVIFNCPIIGLILLEGFNFPIPYSSRISFSEQFTSTWFFISKWTLMNLILFSLSSILYMTILILSTYV